MNREEVHQIDLLALWGKCLLQWRKIAVWSITIAVLFLGVAYIIHEPPKDNCEKYRDIENAIIHRVVMEEQLESAQQSYEDNQFYSMDPEKLQNQRLTIQVELADQSQITDQMDPTDAVLFAYHNLARTDLRKTLVPSVLTKLQWEQLVSVSYDVAMNQLVLSMTTDHEELVNDVVAAAARWYIDQQAAVTEQSKEHELTLLPVSQTLYTREAAEDMVSSVAAEEALRTMRESIEAANRELVKVLPIKLDEVDGMTEEDLWAAFAKQKEVEKTPGKASTLVTGGLLGGVLMMCVACVPALVKGELLHENAVAGFSGWRRIGRTRAVKKTWDPFIRWGCRLLYRDFKAAEETLRREAAGVTRMLLQDAGIQSGGRVALVSAVSGESLKKTAELLASTGYEIVTVELADRIRTNQLCREAEAVIFVGETGKVRQSEVLALEEILTPLEKTPLGYLLV